MANCSKIQHVRPPMETSSTEASRGSTTDGTSRWLTSIGRRAGLSNLQAVMFSRTIVGELGINATDVRRPNVLSPLEVGTHLLRRSRPADGAQLLSLGLQVEDVFGSNGPRGVIPDFPRIRITSMVDRNIVSEPASDRVFG